MFKIIAEMQKLRTDYIVSLKTVLTPEQYAKIEKGGAQPAREKQHVSELKETESK